MASRSESSVASVVYRFLFLLGLAVWLGGLAFVAIGAPAMFRVNRSMGPQMVGAAMGAFTPVTYVCAVLILIGWLGERTGITGNLGGRKLWNAQGLCIVLMIVIAAYLGRVVMPQMVAMQPTVVAQNQQANVSPQPGGKVVNSAIKARFDAAHKSYARMTSINVWLGLATLLMFCIRISRTMPESGGAGEVEVRDNFFVPASGR